MFEICLDDEPDRVLAVAFTPQDALAELDRIADDTARQLLANGEGREAFLLSLAVWDTELGQVVARSGIRG
jgi:hypothetical protein